MTLWRTIVRRYATPCALLAIGAYTAAAEGERPDSTREAHRRIEIDSVVLGRLVDSVMQAGMAADHIPGAAVLIIRDGRVLLEKGYGIADLSSRRPIDPTRTLFPFASITKVITATALMQLIERQQVNLSADVNRYLRAAKVPVSAWGPITAAHLLTHTDLLDELPGRQVASRAERHALGVFLAPRLKRTGPPGQVTRYGTYGMALAGLLIEDVSGRSYADYIRDEIFKPLGMEHTSIDPPLGQEGALATAYEYRDGAAQAVPYEWYETTPTSSLVSTVADMGRFMSLHLGGADALGVTTSRRRTVLTLRTIEDMARQHASIHPAIPGWGYGWQLNDANELRVVEHGGDIGGFSSLLTLVPDEHLGIVVVHHLEGTNLRFRLKRAVLDRFFPHAPHSTKVAARTTSLTPFTGSYLANIYCHTCDNGVANAQRFDITETADGSLSLWGESWWPVAPLLFATKDGTRHIGFRADALGTVTTVSEGAWRVLERATASAGPSAP